ncbi:hypothetical protein [Streptomyces himalayensis]|uniref:Uncharacterized protein n=1 Tax=Streptomyces himalayensis subsp. himalayensis TaxID=2756131 RepID=A0A7W0DVR9_9ACTN|nr:hypothetical protein [Streptomyces himalayensis]MBA2951628.1 hypothetical protein [Streptomyces himalayensis subsp. himalayensis]
MTDQPAEPVLPRVTVGLVLWPTAGDSYANPDVSADEWRHFAEHYADIPLIELWRRLRLAEWNAAEYRRQAEQWCEIASRTPPLHVIEETADRHKRITALLAKPGRISRALLTAALSEREDTWNAREEAS